MAICSCDTRVALLVADSTTAGTATIPNLDVETITGGQIGKLDNLGFPWKALSAIATV